MDTNRIEQEIVIDAPVERVWATITEPAQVGKWFGPGTPAEIDLRPGGIMRLDHGDHGVFLTRFVRVEPPRHLSYRWASGYPGVEADDDNATLVEFSLVPEGDGTRLRLVETGFDSVEVPDERKESASRASHDEGWAAVLKAVRDLAAA